MEKREGHWFLREEEEVGGSRERETDGGTLRKVVIYEFTVTAWKYHYVIFFILYVKKGQWTFLEKSGYITKYNSLLI